MPPFAFQSSLLQSYKALLVKLGPKGYLEEPGSMVHHARSKLWTGVRPRKIECGVDPKGAFSRLKTAFLKAKTEGKRRAEERLKRALPGKLLRRKVAAPSEFGDMFGKNGITRAVMLFAMGSMSKAFMYGATKTTVEGGEILEKALNRPQGQPLITVSNHVGSLDDPLVVAAITPSSIVTKPQNIRWTLCAKDRCFSNPIFKGFFRASKVLPVERGAGLKQLGMRAAEYQLNQGEWIHIFPEGTRSQDGQLLPMRPGIGQLVAGCEQAPLVVPFVHSGMDKVIPRGATLPRPGNTVNVLVGDPIEFDDLWILAKERNWSEGDLVMAITHRVGQRMAVLWSKLEHAPLPSWAMKNPPLPFDTDGEIWKQRSRKGLWSIGTDWRPLSLFTSLAETKYASALSLLASYVEFCGARALGVQKLILQYN